MARDLLTALSLLPETYARALRLLLGGASRDEVGEALGLDPASVEPLLAVADTKLRELLLAETKGAT